MGSCRSGHTPGCLAQAKHGSATTTAAPGWKRGLHAAWPWLDAHLTSLKRFKLSSPVRSRKSFTPSTPPQAPPLAAAAVALPGCTSCVAPLAAWLSTCVAERQCSVQVRLLCLQADALQRMPASPPARRREVLQPGQVTNLSHTQQRLYVAAVAGRQARLKTGEVRAELAVGRGRGRCCELCRVAAVDGVHCSRGKGGGRQGSCQGDAKTWAGMQVNGAAAAA